MNTPRPLPPETERRRIVGTKEAAYFLGMPVRTLRWMRQRRTIPDAIKLSDRKIGFRMGDLMDWLDCREAGREWQNCRDGSASAKFATGA